MALLPEPVTVLDLNSMAQGLAHLRGVYFALDPDMGQLCWPPLKPNDGTVGLRFQRPGAFSSHSMESSLSNGSKLFEDRGARATYSIHRPCVLASSISQ